jgi:chromosome segregation ATPase
MDFSRSTSRATPLKSSPSQERKASHDGSINFMGSLRDEQEDKQRLEKSNFDLKMKVYYLEESLKRYQDGEHMGDVQQEHHRIEINKLKLQLEEKHVDLEQRNLLLIKSKNAIEALKTEIGRLRTESEHQQDLEDRVKRLKQLNDDVETDYRSQVQQLEQQLNAARKALDAKDIERATNEDKLVNHLLFNFSSEFM